MQILLLLLPPPPLLLLLHHLLHALGTMNQSHGVAHAERCQITVLMWLWHWFHGLVARLKLVTLYIAMGNDLVLNISLSICS